MSKSNQLGALGGKSSIPAKPDKNVLEKVSNPKTKVESEVVLEGLASFFG